MTRAAAAAFWALIAQILPHEWEIDTSTSPEVQARKDGDGQLVGIIVRVKPRGKVDTEHLRRKA